MTVAKDATQDEHKSKFGIFREDCFNTFISNLDFSKTEMVGPCIAYTASKGVSYAIIVGSLFFKLP